ncbi:MAG: MscL family protein, partial [Bacteroidales bacterium]|nr:MscL family protein [Bacteroidales bacterium]
NFTDLHFTLKAAKEVDGVLEPAVLLNYGKFLQSAFDFLIIAFSIFLFIRLLSRLQTKRDKEAAAAPAPEPPAPSKEEQLLTEIRDLLADKKN